MNNKKIQGHAAILSANIIFGLGVPVTTLLLNEWVSPMVYMLTRCVGAAAIFWLISLFMPKEHVDRHDLIVICCAGLLGFVISQTLTAWALVYTTPVYFSIIASLTPIVTMILAGIFIGERITGLKSVAVVLGILGTLLLVCTNWDGGTGRNDLLGISLALLSVLTWAVYLIITRHVSARYSSLTQMKWLFLVSSIAVLPMAWSELGSQPLYSAQVQWDGILEMAFIVLFATVAGYMAIPFAMHYLKATTVSTYTNLQPVVASVVAIMLSQDVLTWDKPVALALVLISAYLVTRIEE